MISFVGMQTQEVTIKPHVKVILKSDSELLEEVVVTGYGTFKKASFTGAASTVNTSTLEDVPVLSVADKLSGNVAGVTFGSSSSNPGSVSSIRVRGMAPSMPETIRFMLLTEHRLQVETYPSSLIVMQELIFCLHSIPMISNPSQLSKMRLQPLFTAHVLPMVLWSLRRKAENKAKQM